MKIYKKVINYSILPNEILKHNLSLKAIGLYSYIISKPDAWNFSLAGVASQTNDGPDSVRSAVLELENAGFLARQRSRNADGTLAEGNWWVDEKPMLENPTLVEDPQVNTKEVNTKEDFILEKPEIDVLGKVAKSMPIGLPKTAQTFKKDRKIKQAFRSFQAEPQRVQSFRPPQTEKTIEQSLHDNLATQEDIDALAKKLKVTPEQVQLKKDAYLDFITQKKVPGQDMKYSVTKWIRDDLYAGKIEVHLNAAEQHNKEMWELIHAVEDGSFKI